MVEKAKDRSLDEFFKMMEEKDLYEQDIDISVFDENNIKLGKESENQINDSTDIKILDNNQDIYNYVIETSRIGINSFKKNNTPIKFLSCEISSMSKPLKELIKRILNLFIYTYEIMDPNEGKRILTKDYLEKYKFGINVKSFGGDNYFNIIPSDRSKLKIEECDFDTTVKDFIALVDEKNDNIKNILQGKHYL